MLTIGMKGTASVPVTEANSAKTMGSGTLDVFATPAMIALLERTCWVSVQEALEPGWGSVGISLNVEHSAPTPLGMTVTCDSELIEVDGRKLTFRVVLRDEAGEIGSGTHQRFLIQNEKFQAKANRKLNT
ncbi:MAG: thioesterase family protein [Oscillospiraceae bacterium]|nr:thioesterase family protein [Oscillospiraceae bacterium]